MCGKSVKKPMIALYGMQKYNNCVINYYLADIVARRAHARELDVGREVCFDDCIYRKRGNSQNNENKYT